MSRTTLRAVWLPIIAAVGFAILTWPVWRWLWSEWMANDYYSFGILIPPISLFLIVQRFRNDKTLVYQPGQRQRVWVGRAGGDVGALPLLRCKTLLITWLLSP